MKQEEFMEKLIDACSSRNIPIRIGVGMNNEPISVSTPEPINDIIDKIKSEDKSNDFIVTRTDDEFMANLDYPGLTDEEVEFEHTLPEPLRHDILVMRRFNESVAEKISNIAKDAVYNATNELLSYLTEATAHIAVSTKETTKMEMCRIIDKEED